jgi:hypothetical protein
MIASAVRYCIQIDAASILPRNAFAELLDDARRFVAHERGQLRLDRILSRAKRRFRAVEADGLDAHAHFTHAGTPHLELLEAQDSRSTVFVHSDYFAHARIRFVSRDSV